MRSVGHEQLRKHQSQELKDLPFVITNWGVPKALVIPFDPAIAEMVEEHLAIRSLKQRVVYAKKKKKWVGKEEE